MLSVMPAVLSSLLVCARVLWFYARVVRDYGASRVARESSHSGTQPAPLHGLRMPVSR